MGDYMKENFFNAHLCNVCKSKESFQNSKLCSACKLVSYCSIEHQKQDRKSHRDFCEAAQKACLALGGDDIFDAAVTILLYRKEMNNMMIRYHQPDYPPKSERTNVKMTALKTIEASLPLRYLKQFEYNMIFFPKHCAFCFSRKNLKKELVCTNCFGAAYCSVGHKILDNHRDVCGAFQKTLDMDLFLLNVNIDSPVIHLIKPNDVANLKLDKFDMKSFIAKFIKPGLKFEEEALISFYLTCVLTFAYVVNRIPNFTCGKSLKIYVLGAKGMIEGRVLEHWENLLHLFPGVQSLTIVHIGPGINTSTPAKLKLCADCRSAKKSVDLLFYECRYHENISYFSRQSKPDVILAFNSGIYDNDESFDPWGPSLPLLFQYDGVPLILTEAFKWEVERDLFRLWQPNVIQNKKVRILVNCEENPFNNLRLWRDWTDPDFTVGRGNSFVTALIVECD